MIKDKIKKEEKEGLMGPNEGQFEEPILPGVHPAAFRLFRISSLSE
jgi:hypothetical protein